MANGFSMITEGDIQTLYQEIMSTAIALTRADAGTVQIFDEETQDLLLLATQGFEQLVIDHFYRVNASSHTPCGIALATGDRTFMDFDLPPEEDPDGSMAVHREAGLLSAQSTPLITRSGKAIGMVSTHWHEHHRPSDRQLRCLDLLARQAADLIEQRQAIEALRKSEGKYRALFESMDEAYAVVEVMANDQGEWNDFLFLEVNPAFVAQTGMEYPVGRKATELLGTPNPNWAKVYGQVAQTGQPIRFEEREAMLDRVFDLYVFRLGEAGSCRVGVLFNDITDRKRVEEQLRYRSELDAYRIKLSDELRSLSDPIDIEETVTRIAMNHFQADRCYYCEIKDGNAIIRRDAFREGLPTVAGVYPLSNFPILQRVIEAGRPFVVQNVYTTDKVDEDLRQLCIQMQVISYLDVPVMKNGQAVGVLCLVQSTPRNWTDLEVELAIETADRTWAAVERANAEAALRKSEEKYRSLFEAINDGFALLELLYDDDNRPHDCRFLEVSPSFEAQTGLHQPQGQTMRELIPSIEPDWFKQYHQALVTNKRVHFEMYQNYLKTWFEVDVLPYGNPQNRQVMIVFENINHRKQAEANQIRLIQEQQRAESLAELNRTKTLFFNNVSHEFRTPLTLLLSPLEDAITQLESQEKPETIKEQLQLAHRNALRLLKLVNTLLDFSRVEAQRMEGNYQPTDLAVYTADLASVFRSTIESAGLQFIVDCRPLSDPVWVDRELWEKIVFNLLSNAFKFTFDGEIRVSLRGEEDKTNSRVDTAKFAVLEVEDTGIGISPEELPHIFERFYQSQNHQGRSYEGSGIGLSLVQELVKLHDGTVEVRSQEGQGTTFTVTLPIHERSHSYSQHSEETSIPSPTTQANAFVEEAQSWLPEKNLTREEAHQSEAKAKILIVEDNADMRNYLQKLLNPYYEVETARDGLEASTLIRNVSDRNNNGAMYDLVLTDIMMPRLDGFDLLRSLRNNPETRQIPIILISARTEEESQIEGLEAGADDYLVKPFSTRQLLARVEAHLKLTRMRQIQALNETLEAQVKTRTAQLEGINEELEAFSYSVSHDLQTPLRYISSFVERLHQKLEGTADASTLRHLGIIDEAASQAQQMINHLLEFSRQGKSELVWLPVSMDQLVQEVRSQLQPEISNRIIEWHIEPLPEVQGDSEMLRLVWQNLISNAVKYTCDSAVAIITIGSKTDNNQIVFFVEDNGVGFDMTYRDRLFSLFQRLHSQEQFAGTGVGLANVRRIIHRHGGRVWAQGAVNQGAKFYFSLPIQEETK